jgi:hypothetical protein
MGPSDPATESTAEGPVRITKGLSPAPHQSIYGS